MRIDPLRQRPPIVEIGPWDRRIEPAEFPVGTEYSAVTLSLAKRKGSDATRVAADVHAKIEGLRGRLIPSDVQVSVTRNYGQTANQKVNDLLFKLVIATAAVTFLVWNRVCIPDEVALRIFQRHFSTKEESGRGLGTFAMKLLGERVLGGQVSFTSTEQDGTTFRFRLPTKIIA